MTPEVADGLYARVAQILEHARAHVERTINVTMVSAHWLIECEIIEVEQGGAERATYGASVIENLAQRLTATFGKDYGRQNVRYSAGTPDRRAALRTSRQPALAREDSGARRRSSGGQQA